jgi:hypothetical protein
MTVQFEDINNIRVGADMDRGENAITCSNFEDLYKYYIEWCGETFVKGLIEFMISRASLEDNQKIIYYMQKMFSDSTVKSSFEKLMHKANGLS